MIPSFLITFREVIEASLIVATVLGILVKLKQTKIVKTVWYASGLASFLSIILLCLGSLLGIKLQEIYSGKTEEFIEGTFMIASAIFISWAIFFLHNSFAYYKTKLMQQIKSTIKQQEQRGFFILVFTAVFLEGFEIVLFLSTIFLSTNPKSVFTGFLGGLIGALLVSLGLFTATLRLPVFYAFRITSVLLIFFAAGLFAQGMHEFTEVGFLPEIGKLTFTFIPETTSFIGEILKAVFGITRRMDIIQLFVYTIYAISMIWWVFFRKQNRLKNNI